VRGFLKRFGWLASLMAVFVTGGGHWMALQSVAWACMLVSYSQQADFATALEQTFDGAHPCPMCTKISQDRAQEQREQPAGAPSAARTIPETLCLAAGVEVPPVPVHLCFIRTSILAAPSELAQPPPTPPPRRPFRLA
jgi:hypothetical protein